MSRERTVITVMLQTVNQNRPSAAWHQLPKWSCERTAETLKINMQQNL